METSEPTKIKQGPAEDLTIVPASPPPAKPELYERSPTLMAGEVAGSQGRIRVWSPSRKLLWLSTAGVAILTLLCLLAAIVWHSLVFPYLICLIVPAGGFSLSVASLRRPRLVVTDDAGIAITTASGSCALRWQDIHSARLTFEKSPKIILAAPDDVEIALNGFPLSASKDLFRTIVVQSHLSAHATQAGVFVNPDAPLPETPALSGEADHDIRHEIAAGRMIQAIKLYRERHGTGLKESKDVVDLMAIDIKLSNAQPGLRNGQPSWQKRDALLELIAAGKPEQALSLYRQWTNSSHREAAEAIRLLRTLAAPS